MVMRICAVVMTLWLFLGLGGSALAFDDHMDYEIPPSVSARGRVLEILSTELYHTSYGMDTYRDLIMVRITDGPFRGKEVQVEHFRSGHPAYDFEVKAGERVLLLAELDGDRLGQVYIESPLRDHYLWYLAALFVVLLVLLGGRQGAKAVLSLVIIVLVGVRLLMPLLLRGYSPILLSVTATALVSTLVLGIIGGPNRKTLIAIVGTTGGVMAAGALAALVGHGASLTGLSGEEAQMLLYIPQAVDFDFRGLLFAGIIISALGAVMDVGMSVASSMHEICRVSRPSPRQLFISGMNVGRDIMGTMSNTLILAYAGGAIPLILLFMAYDTPFIRIINMDIIATEVVRALAGSVGLVLCVPITALAGALLMDRDTSARVSGARPEDAQVSGDS